MEKREEGKVIIELKNVCKYYRMGDNIVKAVDNVSLMIKRGDFVAIMGPSGSGKSTMMNLIGSLDVPTRGKIFLDQHDISTLTESELAQIRGKKIGFIFQSFNLINNLTAKENVMIPMLFQNNLKDEKNFRATKLMELVGLKDRMHHTPNELSGGQQQRVAIARSLANSPEVILADEPTGNLDTKTGASVMEFLENLNKKGKTIIMVTHDPDLAKDHADIIFWLKDGKVEKITGKKDGWSKLGKERLKELKENK
ncbi:ABC transporter ATP-binding protein [Candidatus Woesearchaeota archaeon]|mgnify:CR=1 FL=1|jgi:putative ABC transport system ATP-binding protein|nr:ABC transporter ATP-binding protein [Candidatus Woesearchaeota archaeon]MBT4835461.1 ABC transporter ATP-binding protein [Candidatus Woesearchaeota archaeon]MBT6734847.1 ABC transporter ATP-binding protein [Candidatus Woesearchaeota archaeon]MBT7169638.1 ABC transporter ATP-binding protein [Candidatus Woesearchaeota archaeon]MBT7474596.1 ABC transporter ATP-binding protein [Candidatus Woesearchaeota archaeon]